MKRRKLVRQPRSKTPLQDAIVRVVERAARRKYRGDKFEYPFPRVIHAHVREMAGDLLSALAVVGIRLR